MSPEKLTGESREVEPHEFSSVDLVSLEQYKRGFINNRGRSESYFLAVPQIGYCEQTGEYLGIDGEIIRGLGLDGTEAFADIGCSNGVLIKTLVQKYGHSGKLIGVNNIANHFEYTQEELANHDNVEFREGDARDLPIDDESVDVVLLGFLLYHVEHPEQVITEALRILKPGGKLLIATRDPGNHKRLWGFMPLIAEYLKEKSNEQRELMASGVEINRSELMPDYRNITPAECFYEQYGLDRAEQDVQNYGLKLLTRYKQSTSDGNSELRFPNPHQEQTVDDAWVFYEVLMLNGLMTAFGGTPILGGDYQRAVKEVVKPIFYKEVEENGFFKESVEQGFVVAQKP